jgi:UTP-glucose-1-phosphate uridylyltransferase
MKRVWGNKSVEFPCKEVLIVSEEEKEEIEKYFDEENN